MEPVVEVAVEESNIDEELVDVPRQTSRTHSKFVEENSKETSSTYLKN